MAKCDTRTIPLSGDVASVTPLVSLYVKRTLNSRAATSDYFVYQLICQLCSRCFLLSECEKWKTLHSIR